MDQKDDHHDQWRQTQDSKSSSSGDSNESSNPDSIGLNDPVNSGQLINRPSSSSSTSTTPTTTSTSTSTSTSTRSRGNRRKKGHQSNPINQDNQVNEAPIYVQHGNVGMGPSSSSSLQPMDNLTNDVNQNIQLDSVDSNFTKSANCSNKKGSLGVIVRSLKRKVKDYKESDQALSEYQQSNQPLCNQQQQQQQQQQQHQPQPLPNPQQLQPQFIPRCEPQPIISPQFQPMLQQLLQPQFLQQFQPRLIEPQLQHQQPIQPVPVQFQPQVQNPLQFQPSRQLIQTQFQPNHCPQEGTISHEDLALLEEQLQLQRMSMEIQNCFASIQAQQQQQQQHQHQQQQQPHYPTTISNRGHPEIRPVHSVPQQQPQPPPPPYPMGQLNQPTCGPSPHPKRRPLVNQSFNQQSDCFRTPDVPSRNSPMPPPAPVRTNYLPHPADPVRRHRRRRSGDFGELPMTIQQPPRQYQSPLPSRFNQPRPSRPQPQQTQQPPYNTQPLTQTQLHESIRYRQPSIVINSRSTGQVTNTGQLRDNASQTVNQTDESNKLIDEPMERQIGGRLNRNRSSTSIDVQPLDLSRSGQQPIEQTSSVRTEIGPQHESTSSDNQDVNANNGNQREGVDLSTSNQDSSQIVDYSLNGSSSDKSNGQTNLSTGQNIDQTSDQTSDQIPEPIVTNDDSSSSSMSIPESPPS